jgi:hypothetical protein
MRFLSLGVGFFSQVQPQAGLARGFVRSMAFEAAIGHERADIAIELKLFGGTEVRRHPTVEAADEEQKAGNGAPKGAVMHVNSLGDSIRNFPLPVKFGNAFWGTGR